MLLLLTLITGSIFAHNATHKTSKGPGYRIPSKGPMAPRLKAKNPGRQIRLHEQPSPESSYFLFEVVFFDGSTVNLLNFNSPEEFFEAFQADVEAFYNEEYDPVDLVWEFYNNLERDFPTLDLLFRFPNRPDNWNEIGPCKRSSECEGFEGSDLNLCDMDYEDWGYCTTCGDKRDAKACQVHGYWDAEGFKECVKVCANGENPENLEHVDLWWETNDGWISIYDFESADEFIGLVYDYHSNNPESDKGISTMEDAVQYVYDYLEDNIPDYEWEFPEPSAIKNQLDANAQQAAGGSKIISISIALIFAVTFSF